MSRVFLFFPSFFPAVSFRNARAAEGRCRTTAPGVPRGLQLPACSGERSRGAERAPAGHVIGRSRPARGGECSAPHWGPRRSRGECRWDRAGQWGYPGGFHSCPRTSDLSPPQGSFPPVHPATPCPGGGCCRPGPSLRPSPSGHGRSRVPRRCLFASRVVQRFCCEGPSCCCWSPFAESPVAASGCGSHCPNRLLPFGPGFPGLRPRCAGSVWKRHGLAKTPLSCDFYLS